MAQSKRVLSGLVLLIAAGCGSPATPTGQGPGPAPSTSFEFIKAPMRFSGPTLRISVNAGSPWMGTPLPGSVHPRDITPASGFQIIRMHPSSNTPSWIVFLMVEMLDNSRVRAEGYSGPAAAAPTAFTSKAGIFIR